MNCIDAILKKEQNNTDKIFLYLWQDQLMAFNCSAYYANLLFPELEVIQGKNTGSEKFVCTNFPQTYLLSLSERMTILVGDDCIEITVPGEINRHREYFENRQDSI